MFEKGVEAVLSKAMSDAAFAKKLLASADQALIGFDLTTEEASALKNITPADFDAYVKASPEERKSLSWAFNHNEVLLKSPS